MKKSILNPEFEAYLKNELAVVSNDKNIRNKAIANRRSFDKYHDNCIQSFLQGSNK